MELFRTVSKVQGFYIIKADVIHTYLCYNIVAIHKQVMDIASLIKEMSGKSISVINSTQHINLKMLCS
jgi:hypothetical protein